MKAIDRLSHDPRVIVRRSGVPNADGKCVVYWMQRAQRAFDNPALDVAISVANELRKPLVVFFAPAPFYPKANARHFRFLADGVADISEGLAQRRIGFVFRSYPDHSLLKFLLRGEPVHRDRRREPVAGDGTVARRRYIEHVSQLERSHV